MRMGNPAAHDHPDRVPRMPLGPPPEDRLEVFLDTAIDVAVGLLGMAVMFGAIWFILWVWS